MPVPYSIGEKAAMNKTKKVCILSSCNPAAANYKGPSPAVAYCNSVNRYVCEAHNQECKKHNHDWRELNDEERGGN
jgi:hypothetical protein